MARFTANTNSIIQSVYQQGPQPIIVTPKVTNVFVKNYCSTKKNLINRGSAGSSKSYSIGQMLCNRFISARKKNILVVRKSLPSLRISTLPMMYDIMEEFGIRDRVDEEKVMLNYYYKDNWLHFGSIDNPEKIKSSSWSYIWMEEATEFSYEDYLLLKTRLRTPVSDGLRNQMILSFNPKGSKHWIKTKMIDKMTDIEEIVSTYQDNPFLDQDYIDELEDLKNQDINMWRVMAKGLWGELENVIYNNWDAESDRIPDGLPIIYGLDFGYNVPNALVKIGYKDLDLWEEELIYQPKLTITQLITKLKTAIPPKDRVRPIYADSADPAKIVEIRAAGFNIKPASKDVGPGIEFVKRCKVHVIKSSSEIIAEKSSYVWKTDSNSNVLDEPVKFNDHAQDAERYAAYTHIKKGIGTRVRWLN